MPKIDVYNASGKKVSKLELSDAVFGAETKEHLLYAVVRYQRAQKRQGTHAVKNRAAVSGGGRKPFRQKGTGRARAGTTRAGHWRGGGVIFGPVPRDHGFKLNKKVRAQALAGALSRRVVEKKVLVLDELTFPEIKTKQVVALMKQFELNDMLLVLGAADDTVQRSARNLSKVTVLPSEGLNVYDVLHRNNLVLTAGAVQAITDRLGG